MHNLPEANQPNRVLRCDGGPASSVSDVDLGASVWLFKSSRDDELGQHVRVSNACEFVGLPGYEAVKRTDSHAIRKTEGHRFRALAAFCQGFADGIGSPMFELRRSAWKQGYRCEATRFDSKIERPRIKRQQAIGAVPFQLRHSASSDRS